MLSNKIKTAKKNQHSETASGNYTKSLRLVKNTGKKDTSFSIGHDFQKSSCNLNYWGVGPMDKDFMF